MPLEPSTFLELGTILASQAETTPDAGLPRWSQGAIGATVTLVAAWFTYLGVKRKARAEESSTSVESQAKALETLIQGLTARVDKLELQLESIRSKNHDLEQENLALRLEVKHKDDVLEAFARWVSAWEEYDRDGRPDPPGSPPYSWQMAQYLQEAAGASQRIREPPG